MIAAFLVLAGGTAARGWRLSLPALTSDEAFSWRLAGYSTGEMVRRAATDVHPPLFYLLLKPWLALAGDGPATMRLPSVLLGLLAAGIAALVVREASRLDGRPAAWDAGPLVAFALVALHPWQVEQGRNARMYALGIVLSAASSWLLFRALRPGARGSSWVRYGLAVAALAYTHYYAVFTVAAQAVAALVAVPPEGRRRATRGLVVAGMVAAGAFVPWVPVLSAQASQVRASYWIPPLRPGDLVAGFAGWASGLTTGVAVAGVLGAATLGLAIAAARVAGRAARALLVQALLPWALAIAVSGAGPRPVFLDRYMVFAQVALFCFWGAAWPRIGRAARAGVLVLVATAAAGLVVSMRELPKEPPAVARAARFLKRQVRLGDVVVLENPRALNKLRYYGRQADAELDLRCAFPADARDAHFSHLVSLEDREVVPASAVFAERRVVWTGRDGTSPARPAPPGWAVTFVRLFEGGGDTHFLLARYEPVP